MFSRTALKVAARPNRRGGRVFDSFRVKHTLKTVLASLLGLNLAMHFHWSNPYWTVITVFIVMLPYLGASVQKSILRAAGTWAGAMTGVFVAALFPQSQFFFCVTVALVILLGMGFAKTNYGVLLGLGTMMLMALTGVFSTENVWHMVMYRSAEISLGGISAVLVNTFVWPRRAGDSLHRFTAKTLEDLKELFVLAMDRLSDPPGGAEANKRVARHERKLLDGFRDLRHLLDFAERDSWSVQRRRKTYARLLVQMRALFNKLTILDHHTGQDISEAYRNEFGLEIQAVREAVEVEMDRLIVALRGEVPPSPGNMEKAFSRFLNRQEGLRRHGIPLLYHHEDSIAMLALCDSFLAVRRELEAVERSVSDVLSGEETPQVEDPLVAWEAQGRRFDRETLRWGARVVAGLLLTGYSWLALRWPSGVQTMISFFIIMAQPHIPAVNYKILLRLSGALLGCVLGLASIALVLPYLNSIYPLSVLLFFVLGICAYVNNGSPRYAYLGLQAALCFCLIMAHDNSNTISIVTGASRAGGILAGALFATISIRLFWPPVPGKELVRSMAETFAMFERVMSEIAQGNPSTFSEQAIVSRLSAKLDQSRTWLQQTRFYEPGEREKAVELLEGVQFLGFKIMGICREKHELSVTPLMAPLMARFATLLEGMNRTMSRLFSAYAHSPFGDESFDAERELEQELAELRTAMRKNRENRLSILYATHEVRHVLGVLEAYVRLAEEVCAYDRKVHEVNPSAWSFEIPL